LRHPAKEVQSAKAGRWTAPWQVQEDINPRIWLAGEQAAPFGSGVADFPVGYEESELVCGTIDILPPDEITPTVASQI
jgi:hypothetical protein